MTARVLRVLFVEDQEDDSLLAVHELRRAKYRVEWERVENAGDMRRALERDWDVVISDFQLPGFNALGALEVLHASGKDLPFILTSGTVGEDVAAEAMRAGAHDFLAKGRLARLGPAIERAMRDAAERRGRREAEARLLEQHEDLVVLTGRLKQLNRRLTEAQQVAQLAYFEIDEQSHEVFWSKELWQMCGLTPSWDEPPRDALVNVAMDEDKARVRELVTQARDEMREFTEQCRINRPGVGVRTITLKGRLVTDEFGHRKLVGTVQDITERVALESQLRQAQKMEAIGQLAGGVAHDFNNILTVIQGHATLLQEARSDEPADRESIVEIRQAAQRASALTRQLLAFSRQQVLQPRVLNLNDAIAGMQSMLQRLIGETITIHTDFDPMIDLVKADPGQMEQVLLNLAVNARDAMPDGGTLTIETANVTLDSAWAQRHPIKRPGPHVMLAVTDTGYGIPRELRERIFEPFFTTKESGKGTGLGLATVHGIVEQSEGSIWVYSEVGKGTTFKVFLPRCEEAAAPTAAPAPMKPEAASETVLLVEDDVAVRRMTVSLLERAGYHVLVAASGADALKLCEDPSIRFDVVLTDMVMPELGGRDLVACVHQLRPRIPALLMSGYTRDAMGAGEHLAAGDWFIEKPFTSDALIRKVRDVLETAHDSEAA